MAAKTPIPNPVGWKLDLKAYRAAQTAIENHDHHADPGATNTLYEAAKKSEDKVLAQPAPDVGAIADKLLILWGEKVWSELEEGEQMRMIVGDLRRFARFRTKP